MSGEKILFNLNDDNNNKNEPQELYRNTGNIS